MGVTQATRAEHMRIRVQAGLVRPKRIKQWIFYQRDEDRLRLIRTDLLADLSLRAGIDPKGSSRVARMLDFPTFSMPP